MEEEKCLSVDNHTECMERAYLSQTLWPGKEVSRHLCCSEGLVDIGQRKGNELQAVGRTNVN